MSFIQKIFVSKYLKNFDSLSYKIIVRDFTNLKNFKLLPPFLLKLKSTVQILNQQKSTEKLSLADELLTSSVSPEKLSDEKKSKKSQEDKDRTIRTLKFSIYSFGVMISCIGGFLFYSWGSPKTDPSTGEIVKDEFSEMSLLNQYFRRALLEAKNWNKMIKEPSSDRLLPDPLKEPYFQPPYTLVLEMKDILVHPEWTYQTGWRFKKRPGVDFLLQHCGPPHFEIVIYTNEQAFTAYPVIEKLDTNNLIWYKLFKDATRYEDGKHLKDLNCLNRDLNKVIVVDFDKEAITSKRNQLTLTQWNGDMADQTLVDLACMLRTIAESEVSDVRDVLDYYRTFSDPIAAFKENQRLAQQHEAEVKQSTSSQSKLLSWGGSLLRR